MARMEAAALLRRLPPTGQLASPKTGLVAQVGRKQARRPGKDERGNDSYKANAKPKGTQSSDCHGHRIFAAHEQCRIGDAQAQRCEANGLIDA